MKLLLDTHVWIWSVVIVNNELWLSPISVWEASLWLEAKRIRSKLAPRDWIERTLAQAPIIEAPLTHEVAMESRAIALPHADPADRFIAATASVYELVLVTADELLLAARGIKTLAA